MKNWIGLLAVAAFMSACNTQNSDKDVKLTTFEDSISFAIGTDVGLDIKNGVKAQEMDSMLNAELIIAGFRNAYMNDSARFSKEDSQKIISAFLQKKQDEMAGKNLAAGQAFLGENQGKAGVVTTESGLQYIVLKEGEGTAPTLADQVMVHYTGKLLNGEVFDSSYERNEPVTFYVRSVIPGWTEAMQLMKPGAEYKLFIPSNLAYGEQGNPRGGIEPNSVLIFDVKLIEVIKP
ncbi:MAG: FKBP-type peptidyl-prolyl cis-trans isomerase [Flavobacteriales bacterium]|nr:FKBP-type peptidyl-prolyl cis-trans isomerase [Flavobacteriales bacterium]